MPEDTAHFRSTGTVVLVGAGPGDPELLTLKALRFIGAADAIVYDHLVSPEVLVHARADAEKVFVGKKAGEFCCPQRDIEGTLIRLAREGKTVVRLKGGDPFVFGRGGEEALALVAAGIRFRVVPGVTAGVGGLAYAGIPVTHRDTNQAVTFVTGHDMAGDLPGVQVRQAGSDVEVGPPVARRPPHRSRRAVFPHRAPQANTRCIARRKVCQG